MKTLSVMSRNVYYRTAHKIARYLAKKQSDNGSSPARTFFGETFSFLLWSYFSDEFKKTSREL